MKITIIVPNYNGINILRDCLDSLLEHDRKPDQIVVVDNGSKDGSPEILTSEYPGIKLVALDRNTGFTGANNAGIRAADGDLIVLLNNDCIVEQGWLANLEKRMEEDTVAAVTSSMRNISDINVMDSAGGEIDWMGFSRDIGKGQNACLYSKPMDLPFPCGGAVMIRRSALPDPMTLFWEDLFIYQEDLDLGFELLRTGWKVVYEPSAVVRHMHSATTGRGSYFKEQLCIRNRILVLRKHFLPADFLRLRPVIKKWQNLWMTISLIRGRFTLARAIKDGTADGFSLDVPDFKGEMSINQVFALHATRFQPYGRIKKSLYTKAEKTISQENI